MYGGKFYVLFERKRVAYIIVYTQDNLHMLGALKQLQLYT